MTGPLNIHCLQHVPFESPARIGDWVSARGHKLTTTHLYRGEVLPPLKSMDWLVVMGGPMNVYKYRSYPLGCAKRGASSQWLWRPAKQSWMRVSVRNCWLAADLASAWSHTDRFSPMLRAN